MRVTKIKNLKDQICKYCSIQKNRQFIECFPGYIEFGNGIGNDNVIACSEFSPISYYNNYPIESVPELGSFPRDTRLEQYERC